MKFRKFLLAVSVLLLVSGCSAGTEEDGGGSGYEVFYLNSAGTQLVGSEYETETEDAGALVEELLAQMAAVPPSLDCQTVLPERVEKITYRQENNVLYLYTDANYAMMGAVREILCRAALTKTMTQIPGVDYLGIYCAEQPIVDASGNPVGLLSASDFVDSIRNVNSFERTELTLYFANEAGDMLVPEKRTVMRSTNTSLERLIETADPWAGGGRLCDAACRREGFKRIGQRFRLFREPGRGIFKQYAECEGIHSRVFHRGFPDGAFHGEPGADPHQRFPGGAVSGFPLPQHDV